MCMCVCESVCVYTHHLSMNENLGYFHIVAIVNNAIMYIGIEESYWVSIFYSLKKYPKVDLLDHIILFLIFQGLSIMFYTVAAPI